MATTATAYYPYDAGAGANTTESQWRTMTGNTIKTGVISGYLNGLAVTGDSTGMQVKLATGAAWIYGAYGENTSGVQTLSIGASHATLNRYDLIVARNNYTTNVIEWDVIVGTNGASPTVPTVTIDTTKYEIALAYVYVAATVTTITPANVTDVRTWMPGNNPVWWEELGRTTLGSAGDTITINPIAARKYLNIIFHIFSTGGAINGTLRFNNDSGNNYSNDYSINYGAATSVASTSGLAAVAATGTAGFHAGNFDVYNSLAQRKLVEGRGVNDANAGAASGSNSIEMVGKWDNTASQITRVDLVNGGAGDFAIGSQLIVLGHD